VPVYRKHRLIHIHIPKTGGTAIEELFHGIGDMAWGLESWVGQERRDGRWYEYQHLSLSELLVLTNSAFENYFSFAVVRNPYARLVSNFQWRQATRKAHPGAPIQSFLSFETFLKSIPRDINLHWARLIQGADQSWANFLIHVRPQHHYVETNTHPVGVDEVIRFESIETEMTEFLKRYGIESTKIIKPWSPYFGEFYTREMIDIANEIYRRDFEVFSYEMI